MLNLIMLAEILDITVVLKSCCNLLTPAVSVLSSMPFACESNFVDAAAVPNEELVEERAETPLFTLF